MEKILITGASGNVGSQVVQGLLERDQPVAAAVISDQEAESVLGAETPRVFFDFGLPETYEPAFRGVNKLFLMRPPQITDVERYLYPVVDFAKQAGVEQIVFMSLIGVEDNPRVPHYKVEKYILASGVPYTFLRPSFFMQNLNTTHREEIQKCSEIYVPVGNGKTSFIDVRDIGAVGAKVLSESGHENRFYELTGAEALDYYQAADIFSQVLGRKITYKNPNPLSFLWYTLRNGTPLPFALVMLMLYTSTKKGMAERVTGDVKQLLGRSPTSLRVYIQDYQDCWRS